MINIYYNNRNLGAEAVKYWNDRLKKYRTVSVIVGVILAVLGLLCLIFHFESVLVMAVIASIVILVVGVLEIVEYFRMPPYFRPAGILISGILNLVLGILLLTSAKEDMVGVFAFVFAIEMMIFGIESVSAASQLRFFGDSNSGLLTAEGIVSIILAVIFFLVPHTSVTFISIVAGVYLMAAGVGLIVYAIKAKELKLDEPADNSRVIDVQ